MSSLFQRIALESAQFEIGITTISNKGHQVRQAVFKMNGIGSVQTVYSYLVIKQVGNGRVEEIQFSDGQFQSYLHKTFVEHWLCCKESGKDIEYFNELGQLVNGKDGNDVDVAFNVSGTPRMMGFNGVVSLSSTQEREVCGSRWYPVASFDHCKIGVLTLWPKASKQLAVFDVDGEPYALSLSEWSSLREFWRDVVSETKIVVALDEQGFKRSGSGTYVKTFTPLSIIQNGFKQALSERFNEAQLFMELRSFSFFAAAKKPWISESESFAIGFCELSNQVLKVDRHQTLHLTVLSFNQRSNSWVIGFEDAPVGVLEIPHLSDVVMYRDQEITIKAVVIAGRLVNPIYLFDDTSEPRSLFDDWRETLKETWQLDHEYDVYSAIRNG